MVWADPEIAFSLAGVPAEVKVQSSQESQARDGFDEMVRPPVKADANHASSGWLIFRGAAGLTVGGWSRAGSPERLGALRVLLDVAESNSCDALPELLLSRRTTVVKQEASVPRSRSRGSVEDGKRDEGGGQTAASSAQHVDAASARRQASRNPMIDLVEAARNKAKGQC